MGFPLPEAHRELARPVRIATIGDVVLDVIVTGEVRGARDALGGVRVFPGGSAANFAVTAARAGAEVTFFGRVGDDVAGRLLVAELERAGVNARVHATRAAPTGSILVLVGWDGPGSSRMISDPGASALLAPEDLDARALGGADVVHVTGYSWLREGPSRAAREAARHAREGGAILTIDPGPAHLIVAHGRERLREEIAAARFDVLFPNREEGEAMTGETQPRAIATALAAIAPVAVLKTGGEGCLVAWGGRVEHVPAEEVAAVVDTTGAGDAFAAGFALDYARTRDPLSAARAGTSAAGASVARLGARG